jgi:hypothetical protein
MSLTTQTGNDEETETRSRRIHLGRNFWILVAIVVVGAILRIVGIWWGLPHDLHPDEPVIVNGALDLARRHSFEPNVYFRPDHVEIQLSYIAYTAVSEVVFHTGVIAAHTLHAPLFLLLSRLVTLAFGLVMIVLAYFIGREFSRRVGFIAAAITAVLPSFVEHSHYATPDVPLTAVMMGVVLALMRYLKKPSFSSLFIASACTSIGIAIKYPAALAIGVIGIVVIYVAIRDKRLLQIVSRGILTVVAVIVFLFFISPVLFTNYGAVLQSLHRESRSRGDDPGFGDNLLFYFGYGAGVFGILLLAALILGAVDVIRRRRIVALPLLISVVLLIGLSTIPVHWERWALPMFIAPVLLASLGIAWAWELAPRMLRSHRLRVALTAIVGVIIAGNLLSQSVAIDAQLSVPDARIVLKDKFASLGITEANSIYEGYSPLEPGSLHSIFPNLTLQGGQVTSLKPAAKWIVLSSCMTSHFDGPSGAADRAMYGDIRAQLSRVLSTTDVRNASVTGIEPLNVASDIQTLVGYAQGGHPGCRIQVYKLPANS